MTEVFITGGTGSLARRLITRLLEAGNYRITVYSRCEYKQAVMRQNDTFAELRYVIGDIRDLPRLQRAMIGSDYVIHTAALKRIDSLEENPGEAIKTNVIGTENVITAAIQNTVERAVFISTDKAVKPVNFYGASKMLAEKMWLAANREWPCFSVVRYGNVMSSRGSVLPYFLAQLVKGVKRLPVTDEQMTRFWLDYRDAVNTILEALDLPAGIILIRRAPSFRVVDLVSALAFRGADGYEVIGIRKGEKLHEILVSEAELSACWEHLKYFIIPASGEAERTLQFEVGAIKNKQRYEYNSGTNATFLTIEGIRDRVKHILDQMGGE